MQELAVPLRTYKENFPNKKYLHPYERSLIELTLGDGNYEDVTYNHPSILFQIMLFQGNLGHR